MELAATPVQQRKRRVISQFEFSSSPSRIMTAREPQKPWVYNAVVNVGDPTGVHHRVSITANSPAEALEFFQSQFGEAAIIRFWCGAPALLR
jgi:hypothetical protein